jgi:hypothetical protein
MGNEAIFWKDEHNNAFINSNGEMRVTSNWQEIKFTVDRCPKCGRLFKGVNYLNLRRGDDIWYADKEENCVEHGKIHSICIKDDKVESFSVDFDCEDFDEFDGKGLGVYFFMHKIDAEDALVRPDDKVVEQSAKLAIGDHLWYIDKEANEMNAEHCVVQHVLFDNDCVDYFIAKFDNGDIEEFGPCALEVYCFKSKTLAEMAWRIEHGLNP